MELRAWRENDAEALVAAHRGAWRDAPQNSLQALSDAISLGCEMVEFDVRRTRDGKLVAVHDARVGGAAVAALDLGELRERLGPGHAPLLEEMLELAAGRIALDVELKDGGGAVGDIVATLARHLEPDSYVVSSFYDGVVTAVHEAAPELTVGLLLRPGRRPRRLQERLQTTGASFLGLPMTLARAGLLAWAANHGRASMVWTVNDRRLLRSMLGDDRVAAVITDRPELALELRATLA
ncbi:MAG: glycerophosphodiester phosphodiesterase [Solirubrobacteraceae bacterium]